MPRVIRARLDVDSENLAAWFFMRRCGGRSAAEASCPLRDQPPGNAPQSSRTEAANQGILHVSGMVWGRTNEVDARRHHAASLPFIRGKSQNLTRAVFVFGKALSWPAQYKTAPRRGAVCSCGPPGSRPLPQNSLSVGPDLRAGRHLFQRDIRSACTIHPLRTAH